MMGTPRITGEAPWMKAPRTATATAPPTQTTPSPLAGYSSNRPRAICNQSQGILLMTLPPSEAVAPAK
jgi:hypothetical protein